jgi:hypothetical protein
VQRPEKSLAGWIVSDIESMPNIDLALNEHTQLVILWSWDVNKKLTTGPIPGVFRMTNSHHAAFKKSAVSLFAAGIMIGMAVFSTGCQSSIGGQTLPSGFYLDDDIQYFPSGSENKLSREAAALKAARAEATLNN